VHLFGSETSPYHQHRTIGWTWLSTVGGLRRISGLKWDQAEGEQREDWGDYLGEREIKQTENRERAEEIIWAKVRSSRRRTERGLRRISGRKGDQAEGEQREDWGEYLGESEIKQKENRERTEENIWAKVRSSRRRTERGLRRLSGRKWDQAEGEQREDWGDYLGEREIKQTENRERTEEIIWAKVRSSRRRTERGLRRLSGRKWDQAEGEQRENWGEYLGESEIKQKENRESTESGASYNIPFWKCDWIDYVREEVLG
jgi:uncharacterized protein YjbJ (UPF0337 family)